MDPQQPEPESGGGMCAKIEGERDEPLALIGQERRTENSTASCVAAIYSKESSPRAVFHAPVYDSQGRLVATA